MNDGERRSRAPWGLAGMLAIVAMVEGRLADQPIARANRPAISWRFAAEAAGSEDGAVGAEVLCLGDSLIKLGVQPEVLRRRLGVRAYNLAMLGGQAPSSFFALRRALEAGARPDLVVVGFDANLLAVAPRMNAESWPALLDARDWLDFSLHGRDAELAARVGLARVLPSLRDRRAIRDLISAALHARGREAVPDLRALVRNWEVNDGGQVVPSGPRVPIGASAVGDDRPGWSWRPHPVNASYVRRLIDLAGRRGIPVAWLVPPTRPDWSARREALGLVEPYDRFVAEVQAEAPGLIVIDARDAGYPAEVFRDGRHLDGLGAVALSEALAEALRPRFDEDGAEASLPRRIALRPFEEPPTALALEDLDRSREALGVEPIRR